MLGDSSDATWGVIDLFPRTDFPDIRKKTIVRSTSGTLMIIPREGDAMVRFYIELPADTMPSQITLEHLHARAQLIFRPYELEVAETKWWSAYAVGQRLAEKFHSAYRVFLTGDACHTHSPKAGQGMNVSLQDGYNIGWKLGAYLAGQADVELVKTYVEERQRTAAELIAFDRTWSKIFQTGVEAEQQQQQDASYVRDRFVQAGRYTAGQAYKYGKSIIVWPPPPKGATEEKEGTTKQQLVVGMRFPSAQVVRYSDAKVVQLLSLVQSDCRWRVVVFAGDMVQRQDVRAQLEIVDASLAALVAGLTPAGEDMDSVVECLLVVKMKRTDIELEHIPGVFKPVTGPHHIRSEFVILSLRHMIFRTDFARLMSLTDLHKVLVDDYSYNSGHGHAFDALGIDPKVVTVVIVRPDQCESCVHLHLIEGGTTLLTQQVDISLITSPRDIASLGAFFDGFMIPPKR